MMTPQIWVEKIEGSFDCLISIIWQLAIPALEKTKGVYGFYAPASEIFAIEIPHVLDIWSNCPDPTHTGSWQRFLKNFRLLSLYNGFMKTFSEQKFDIPELNGISKKTVEEHLGLYAGYVKNWNAINAELEKMMQTDNPHSLSEMQRRLSFEFGGMRLHEYYFAHFEGGSAALTAGGDLEKALTNQYGSVENLKKLLKNIGLMRGPGWAILYYDKKYGQFLTGFSGEQHQGHFVTLPIILAIDVWEHAFILDYGAQGKGKYIDAFFENLNWQSAEENYENARG
jgi:superoxide dismutase, Fe-Mn family